MAPTFVRNTKKEYANNVEGKVSMSFATYHETSASWEVSTTEG